MAGYPTRCDHTAVAPIITKRVVFLVTAGGFSSAQTAPGTAADKLAAITGCRFTTEERA